MAQQIQPAEQMTFGGVVTTGSPINRPPSSSTKCNNFRVMPGGYLRLRSGRVAQSTNCNPSGTIRKLHEVRLAAGSVTVNHLFAIDRGDGTTYWQRVLLNDLSYNTIYVEQIDRTHGYSEPGYPASTNVRNKVFIANGLGVRDGTNSKSPLSSLDASLSLRYVGLDAYCPGGKPGNTSSANVSGTSTISFWRDIYVGLYNSATGHYGNGVQCGARIQAFKGFVTATSLSNLKTTYHTTQSVTDSCGSQFISGAEQSELFYVFYATLDGGNVPYLLTDTSGNQIQVPTFTSSKQLDLDSYVLNTLAEMPINNYPPRPMADICYANGRVYGAPTAGGASLGDKDFNYPWNSTDYGAVVWSAAADDVTNTSFVGIPEESWPLLNKKYTPNGQTPLLVKDMPDGTRVLVVTKSGTFILEETATGLHQWYTVSLTDGIYDPRSYAVTKYGQVWFTQNKQIVMLPTGGAALQVLSNDYAELLKSPAAQTPAAYVLDPVNLVDRYQLWTGSGSSVCHDFAIGGQAYTTDSQSVVAAKMLLDASDRAHHVIAIGSLLYTQEGQPSNGIVPVYDQTGPVGGASASDFTGDYIQQWVDFADVRSRKEISEWVIVGDAALSTQLSDTPMTLSWFGDLDGTEYVLTLKKLPQSDTDMAYQGKVSKGIKRWFKGRIKLAGHRNDATATYVSNAASGDVPPNQYGCVWESALTVGNNGNR